MKTTLLPIATLILGFAINEIAQQARDRRARSHHRQDRREEARASTLTAALAALDEAYEAAAAIGLNSDQLGSSSTSSTPEHWAQREPYVTACGRASFRIRALAVVLAPNKSPRLELEKAAGTTANMTGEGTTKQIVSRWQEVEPSVIEAREAVGASLRAIYDEE